jgi:hypothetical protein
VAQFYADHDAVRRFGSTVTGQVSGAEQAATYAATWVHVPDSSDGEIFRNFIGTARDVESAVGDALERLRSILHSSGAELAAAADLYRDTDTTTAATMDSQHARLPQQHTSPGGTQPR